MGYLRKYHSNTGFRDLLYNILLVFVFLFVVALSLIAPVKKEANITTKAEYIITLTWTEDSIDDIDMWLRDPLGYILFFRDQEKGFMHLDKDDLGSANDTIKMPDGTEVVININQEIVTIRGFIPGEWVLNIHMFRKWHDKPSEVKVKVEKLNPSVKTVIYKEYSMYTAWEEITVARFTMTANGEIIDMDDLPMSLIEGILYDSDSADFSYGGDNAEGTYY